VRNAESAWIATAAVAIGAWFAGLSDLVLAGQERAGCIMIAGCEDIYLLIELPIEVGAGGGLFGK